MSDDLERSVNRTADDSFALGVLFGSSNPPFYIFAPPLIGESAGVRLLYQLAHMLNSSGEQAWIVLDRNSRTSQHGSFIYTAPLLTQDVADLHFRQGMTPVVIYPEIVDGNPLKAPVVARWFLNTPGVLQGPTSFSEGDSLFAYTSRLAQEVPSCGRLFLPTTDVRELDSIHRVPWRERSRSSPLLAYAVKYRRLVGEPRVPGLLQGQSILSLESEGPRRQTRPELLGLLASARLLVAYENTAVISEAVLLGTPVVLVRSPFFPALLADAEIGTAGTAWTTDDAPLESAVATLGEARRDYEFALDLAKGDLDAFRLEMRERAQAHRFRTPLDFNWRAALPRASLKARLSYARELWEQRGAKALTEAMLDSLERRLGNHGPMT